ncbi:hypothetical protein AKJ09_09773 [Labilithrix luteola]|uniref:HYDIN/VesB/CFA65-like Ig-like domain-containing protein n=1 Tax=Labilithrix luteola TaxID=1391654 RepID=A0A0K1QCF2_9BACT|nr:choice-of-anchor D domain-containing protein [Labilithrix luteola]AKV03110.1 hypothetical protein AKJ09_09773 [Labilithrix luteola]
MAATLAGTMLSAANAKADVNVEETANSAIASTALRYEFNKGLGTSISTGTYSLSGGGVTASLEALVEIEPVKNAGPLFIIDMPKGATVEASWTGDKKIVLTAVNGATTDGSVAVRHSLAPTVRASLSGWGMNASFDYDATKLINKIPGARFNYDSKATQAFAPWGFTKVDTKLNAPDLENAKLFEVDLSVLPELISDYVTGTMGVRAITNPTFTYASKSVRFDGADGVISSSGGQTTVTIQDGDYLETMLSLEGEMVVNGSIKIQPFIRITSINGTDITFEPSITAFAMDYTTPPQKVAFQSVLVHLPLPNVKAPTKGYDFGDVKAGGSATKSVTIKNTGEKAAVFTVKTSDSQFKVPSGQITIEPKGKTDIKISFAADNAGPAEGEITIQSNDPDSPAQKFKVGANGADIGATEGDADLPTPATASGCGCKTTGGTTNSSGWAGIGLAALGAAVMIRRRRNAA